MTPAWSVIWKGKGCTVFLNAKGEWSLDPVEAYVFPSWVHARVAAGVTLKASVVRCWT
jgi:hypothetical protein